MKDILSIERGLHMSRLKSQQDLVTATRGALENAKTLNLKTVVASIELRLRRQVLALEATEAAISELDSAIKDIDSKQQDLLKDVPPPKAAKK